MDALTRIELDYVLAAHAKWAHIQLFGGEDAGAARANLRWADLYGANLRGANLRGANLRGADLTGADLRGANLYGANLGRAILYEANLRGANLRGADLTGADLRGANLTGANLYGANLRGADLTGADLRGADLTGADLRGANLTGADLRGADLTDGTTLPTGESWAVYLAEVVPALCTAGGRALEEVAKSWGCKSWVGKICCPMATAFDCHDLDGVPALHRPRAAQFIPLHDAGLIPNPCPAAKAETCPVPADV